MVKKRPRLEAKEEVSCPKTKEEFGQKKGVAKGGGEVGERKVESGNKEREEFDREIQ